MKTILFSSVFLLSFLICTGQGNDLDKGQIGYIPSDENLQNREWFRDAHFGMFIHWGVSSVLGKEIGWALSGQDVSEYRQNMYKFNPVKFDAAAVVKLAKDAGMKYITFTTRHHDSFSMFDTRYSDWGIMGTQYAKDVLKMLADECQKQGIRLFCYYSLTDFYRRDYCQGNVKKGTGIEGECNWDAYIQFMKNQLTEILTNYGPIYGIWFDGHWDQVERTGNERNGKQLRKWGYDEIYKLIHDLQPGCMIVNNHHLATFPGEDYQTFERDLPGSNTGGGYSADAKIAQDLPLESSDIIGKSWGFTTNDTIDRSVKELVHLLIGSAGLGSNLLLNIGPTPEGEVRQAHKDRLMAMGEWLKVYGETIYGTRKSFMKPAEWGVAVEKGDKVYIHIMHPEKIKTQLTLNNFPYKVNKAYQFETGNKVEIKANKKASSIDIQIAGPDPYAIDNVIVLQVSK
ncbi:MAG TPA: alpha-L-fucosidase [Bacteroidales bacterium]|nr:alpha-L-fucosidase [Bacteroidales bacterium]